MVWMWAAAALGAGSGALFGFTVENHQEGRVGGRGGVNGGV